MVKLHKIKNFRARSTTKGIKYTITLFNGKTVLVKDKKQYLEVNKSDLISYIEEDGELVVDKVFPYIKGDTVRFPEGKYLKTNYKLIEVDL